MSSIKIYSPIKKEPLINFALIVSNNPLSPGLKKAQQLGYNCRVLESRNNNENFERCLHKLLVEKRIQLVCLAGFMKILSHSFTRTWEKRIINIHPSLLPKFKGLNTHSRALESREQIHGCTVHYVNEKLDSGEILDQAQVKITKDDKKFYKKRILSITKELFYKTNYPQSIKKLHNSYISQIVEYFQICDREDILQEEYNGMENTDDLPNIDDDLSIDDANKGLFNNVPKENTIDDFVTTKQINLQFP